MKKITMTEEPMTYLQKLSGDYYVCPLPYGARDTSERKAYKERDGQLHEEFVRDMFDHYGVAGHPKAQQALSLAWQYGHAGGHREVDGYFSELVELLKP